MVRSVWSLDCPLRSGISFAPLPNLFPVVALFTVTLFVSAGLLFLMQPMFAPLVLPLLGGSPAVWNTAMVFYQATLLAGYRYAHFIHTYLSPRRQAAGQVLLFLIPLALLPIAIPDGWTPPATGHPALWQLALMGVSVGLPFLAISTSSPVLQKWFAATGHPRAVDPYFLSVASNIGSLLALLAYPFLVEPRLAVATQTRLWTWGYFLLLALVATCAYVLCKTASSSAPSPAVTTGPGHGAPAAPAPAPSARRRTRWVLLSFAPSSLMLGVTTYLSSEIAVVPLLWIVPLALYLLTFIIVFARRPILPRTFLRRALPIVIVSLVMVINMRATQPIAWLMSLHVAAFFLSALARHGALAADRPSPTHLTEFYLWMSVGGGLGGLFNALLAPALFNTIVEYPLAVLLACLLALLPPRFGCFPSVANGSTRGAPCVARLCLARRSRPRHDRPAVHRRRSTPRTRTGRRHPHFRRAGTRLLFIFPPSPALRPRPRRPPACRDVLPRRTGPRAVYRAQLLRCASRHARPCRPPPFSDSRQHSSRPTKPRCRPSRRAAHLLSPHRPHRPNSRNLRRRSAQKNRRRRPRRRFARGLRGSRV